MSRLPFLACVMVLILLASGFEYGRSFGVDARWGWVAYPLLLFPSACILSKRLHDRGRAGWWGFLVVWALVEAWPRPSSLFGYAGAAALAVTFVDLGLMPGTPGVNRFGANPAEARS